MSSLVIGLNINDYQVTSSLVRIEHLSKKKLSIERDAYYTRSFDINSDADPRDIISIWIECIDDLLQDFIRYYEEHDNITGISIGIPPPMDYESGICYHQSAMFNKFFGLNLRLAFENGLKKLISRWKRDYYDKHSTPSIKTLRKKSTTLDKLREQQSKRVSIATSHTSAIVFIPSTLIETNSENEFPKKSFSNHCGSYFEDNEMTNDDELSTSISRSRRETYFHDIEISPLRKSSTIEHFNPKSRTVIEQLANIPISFYNDTTCFALGEANNEYNRNYNRILALTLDTNFGSAFIDRGKIITNRQDIPPNGTLGNCFYDKHSIADDWFSVRGLVNIYQKILRNESFDESSGTSSMTSSNDDRQTYDDNLSITDYFLARRASYGDTNAMKTFQTYARLLGEFLRPYINAFHPDLIIISGNLAQVWYLLEDELNFTIRRYSSVQIYFSLSLGKSICLGAVQQQLYETPKNLFRQTHHSLLPAIKTIDTSEYDIYPSHQIPGGSIHIGHRTLNEKLFHLIKEDQMLLIDGFVGAYFNEYAHELNKYYSNTNQQDKDLLFYDSRTYLQIDSNNQRELNLKNSQSLFGKTALDLHFKKDFIDLKKLNLFKTNLSSPCVVIGPGSSYINETSPLIYIDLPKNELYYRISSHTSSSYLKPIPSEPSSIMYEYKCLYYLDYPIFNKLKQELLPRINYFIDSQRPKCPTWIDGNTFRQSLVHLSNQPIRVRPWFESTIWGGQWLKTVCKNLSKHAKNYGWSFEMITSENGIILSDRNNHLLEFSWEIFYGSQSNRILGNDIHQQLFNDFPIRFNFLDTMNGGNLSLHTTPNLEYNRKNFGEYFPQDETYYIIETKEHWKGDYDKSYIYLGFQENIKSNEFYDALILSLTKKQDLDIEKYIQILPTDVHDLFLIPNQTIHALGRNQVALEISSAPYIYSFKLYDWLKSTSLNIEHGMNNLNFNRHGQSLRCQPIRIKYEDKIYEEQHLPTHDLHFYDIQRIIIEPNENIQIKRLTENRFHLCILVEGDAIEIEFNSIDNNQEQYKKQYNYIETFLIPASINEYKLRPIIKNKNHQKKFILLVAFIKWDCEKLFK